MLLEQARKEAYARGLSYRPAPVEQFEPVDVADFIYAVLEETHPADKRPSQRYDREGYRVWLAEQEAIRLAVWEAFEAGVLGAPLKISRAAIALPAIPLD